MNDQKHKVTLVTGGSRSGKSSHALMLAEAFERKTFLATAQALDDEMRFRIENHQRERGNAFQTAEEPLEIAKAIELLGNHSDVIVVDCLTVWLGNLNYLLLSEEDREQRIEDFIEVLKSPPCQMVIVTNEIGMGIVPETKETRLFRDNAGFLNQQVAEVCDRVILMVSGIPVTIKPSHEVSK